MLIKTKLADNSPNPARSLLNIAAVDALALTAALLAILEALAVLLGAAGLAALAAGVEVRLHVLPDLLVAALLAAALVPTGLSVAEALAVLGLAVGLDAAALQAFLFDVSLQQVVDLAVL